MPVPVWVVELRRRAELSEPELAEQAELGRRAWAASSEPDARYPSGLVWSTPTWLALVRDPNWGPLNYYFESEGRFGTVLRYAIGE